MNTQTIARTKWLRVLVLTVIATLFFIGMGLTTSAHAAGTYTLTVKYDPNVDIDAVAEDFGPTPITLYKVGDHARDEATGKAYFELATELSEVTLPTEGKDEPGWRDAWLGVAEEVKGLVAKNKGELHDKDGNVYPVSTNTIPATGTRECTFDATPGLYLVIGEAQKVTDPATKITEYWYPQPMLVQVLQAPVECALKPLINPAVAEIKIVKGWQDEGKKEFEPDHMDFQLIYSGTPSETKEVTLYSEDRDNVPKWTAVVKISTDQDDPSKWSLVEDDQTGNYKADFEVNTVVDPSTGQTTITYTVANIYERYSLKLIKDLPIYVQHAEGKKVDTVFTFVLNGYRLGEDGKEQSNPVFHKIVALQFSEAGQQELEVPEIPRGLSRLEVTELKHVNYKAVAVDGEKDPYVKDAAGPDDEGVYTVSFKNDWDGNVHYEGSAINHYKYKEGKYAFDFTKGIVRK